MAEAVSANFNDSDVYIGAAAIADYTPDKTEINKIKKSGNDFEPKFKRTIDVLAALKEKKTKQILIGFSVETRDVYKNSLNKLRNKNLDMIIVNNPNVAGAAFEADTNKVTIINKNGAAEELPLLSKLELSDEIINRILKLI
jgi:phosphopantothenoylcysteine decarboxylase/phosphopantothenate--cysteine ligase